MYLFICFQSVFALSELLLACLIVLKVNFVFFLQVSSDGPKFSVAPRWSFKSRSRSCINTLGHLHIGVIWITTGLVYEILNTLVLAVRHCLFLLASLGMGF